MTDSPFHFFGIRHHGPGCARSLVDALEKLQPDCILLEGPPEGEALLDFLRDPELIPPVALLIFNPDNSQQAAFYPFAVFSPEWQALQYSTRKQTPLRFMDLSVAQSFALKNEADECLENINELADTPEETDADISEDENNKTHELMLDTHDPLDWLGRAAGYDSGEAWWNHLVEERCSSSDLFAAIREAMVTVRAEAPRRQRSAFDDRREILREASMRKIMREAQKENFSRIAVICGAWHLPALETLPSAKADNDLLKGLAKIKTSCTWVPWSYPNLTYQSGYAAGVLSPQWYEHVWLQSENHHRGIQWLTKAAHLFRTEELDCSSAQIIDAMRLAESLAALRDKPQPGLDELFESLTTTVCMGDSARLQLIRQKLIVGEKLGQIPASVPSIPLQRDLEQQQKSLRMKADVTQKVLDLDLRQANDLARSHLLHRLNILKIHWGHIQGSGHNTKGSFHEVWTIQWQPEFSLAIIDAGRWGNSVEEAASKKIIAQAQASQSLRQVADLLNELLLADLPDAMPPVSQVLENLAATSGDLLQLLGTIPPLTQISRYGNVRKTDTELVNHLLQHLVPRTAIALSPGCHSLDEDAARDLQQAILKAHQSVQLIAQDELTTEWMRAIKKLRDFSKHPGLIAGMATRLIFDAEEDEKDFTAQLMSQALSIGNEPVNGALWLEGFLQNSAMILLHDENLWRLINQWLLALGTDYFVEILPLMRRSFGQFSASEKRQLGQRAKQASTNKPIVHLDIDSARADKALLLVKQLLGMES